MTPDAERSNRPVDLSAKTAHKFDLASLAGELLKAEATSKTGKTAVTLARSDRMTVVLTAMKEGAKLEVHKASSPVIVNVLSGRIVFSVNADGDEIPLETSTSLVMSANLPHSARALSDTSLLLVIGGRPA